MDAPIVGGLLAFLAGCAVSSLNYWISLRTLKRKPSALASMSSVRQILSVICIAVVYLLAKRLPWGTTAPLVGAAVGLTVPSVLLSFKLAKINDSLPADAAEADSPGKGEDQNE